MIHALLIPADNDVMASVITLPDELRPRLDKLHEIIGCKYVERVRVGENESMAVDDTGSLKDARRLNERASILYGVKVHGTPIYGDVVLMAEGYVDDGVDWIDRDPEHLQNWLAGTLLERM